MLEICRDRAELEQITGAPVRGFAYTQGGVNADIVAFLKQCGFLYARHARSTYAFDMPADPYMIQPTCHFLEEQVPALAKAFVERKITTGVLQKNTEPALFYIWGHSYELRRKGEEDYKKTEALLEYLSGREDIWYCTNLQLFEYKKAFDELVYGIDRTFLHALVGVCKWKDRPVGSRSDSSPVKFDCFPKKCWKTLAIAECVCYTEKELWNTMRMESGVDPLSVL